MTSGADQVDEELELHEIQPREQSGAVTGARYDFQYHQAAADALRVLDDTDVACVYCEWHDDYVIEAAGVVSYRFHQVKTRSASQGPWRLSDFFGVPRRRTSRANAQGNTPAASDSIFARFFDHVGRFGPRCELFVFVTDAGVATEFTDLLEAIRSVDAVLDIEASSQSEFTRLLASLSLTFTGITADQFFKFFKCLVIQPAIGSLSNMADCRTLIGGRILQLSEVDLTQSQSQKIGAELVAAVRERSHRILNPLPDSLTALRAAKGLVIEDILKLLSLSSSGYRELRANGRDGVVALSRLHRLLTRSELPASAIPQLCGLKASWDAWWVTQRHVLNGLDVLALRAEVAAVLSSHASGFLDFGGLRAEAGNLAIKYRSILTSTEPLTDELVFGLLLSMAVEADQ